MTLNACPGCGGLFARSEGATHAYMHSSAGCWAKYGDVLAREYANPRLTATHRLSVDTYAVQHPGSHDRRAIQSVVLHLARLMMQLENPRPPRETNEVMLGLGPSKSSLPFLEPPASFGLTVADIPLDGSLDDHAIAVRTWAEDAWSAWGRHHDFIRSWAASALRHRS